MTPRRGSEHTKPPGFRSFIMGTLFLIAYASNAASASIATYAADCTTPQTTFVLGDTICAKAVGLANLTLQWVNPDGYAVAMSPMGSDPAIGTFVLPTTGQSVIDSFPVNNLGRWRVNAVTLRNSARTTAFFSVADAAAPKVDLEIAKNLVGTAVPEAGSPVEFVIEIANHGPNDAVNVHFVDAIFTNASFGSLRQVSGPQFTCAGSDCTVASLPSGAVATFILSFTAGAAGGILENTATVSNDVPELNPANNSATSPAVQVRATGGTPATCYLLCPNNVVVSTNAGSGGTIVTLPTVDVSGTCGTVTLSPASGSFFPTGTTTVTATSSTGGGVCSFTVTGLETPAPAITCPADIAVTALKGSMSANVPEPAADNSNPGFATATGSNVIVTGVRSDDDVLTDPYPIGLTNIRWTATDDGGRSANCVQRITVTSPAVPTIACAGRKTFSTSSCQVTVSAADLGAPTVTGEGVTVTSRRSDDLQITDPYPVGDTLITWTASNDISSASCVQTIHVDATGTSPPVLAIPPDLSTTTSSCTAILDDELGVATAVAACGAVSVVRMGVPPHFVFPTGTTNITYIATDAAGLKSTAVQHVTVSENPRVRPTIGAPADVTAYTGVGAAICAAVVSDGTLGTASASDNCPGVAVTRTGVPDANLFPVGQTPVTYTAADASGNASSATQTVIVIDNTLPAITCPSNITLEPTCPSGAVATWTAPAGTDNCGQTTTQARGPVNGSVLAIGSTTEISYSVSDPSGNEASCNFSVAVRTIPGTIETLKTKVAASNLKPPQSQGLLPKLESALDALSKGKPGSACQSLSNFETSVRNLVDHGDVPASEGHGWIATATHLMNALGCSNDPCS
jgi:uncharacterized repeat protein (TIGR01451 family)